MSEPELAYMSGANDDFDLPRWQTQSTHLPSDILPSSTAANPSYLYPVPPPPAAQTTSSTSRNRAPPPSGHHSPSSSTSRQPRINHLLEDDPPLSSTSLPYLSPTQNQLSRSASLGASAAASTRTRRHHMPDDLEGAYGTNSANPAVHQRQHSNSFYNSSVAYQAPSFGANTSDSNPNSQPAASDATYQDITTQVPQPALLVRHSGPMPTQSLLDPYAQQSQYSPTSASYNYQSPSFHARSHSQTKVEVATPPISSPYSQPSAPPVPPPPIYSPSYAMDTGSPHLPPSALLTQPLKQNASISTPSTPIGFPVPQHSPAPTGPYYPQSQDQPMMVDPPTKRRASGLRRVRDQRDLRPQVRTRPASRRMDASGAFLSPLRQLTTYITDTYRICNPQFKYESTHNPRRVLTKPSKPAHNEGYDNEDYDYILYVNDWLGTEEGHKYLILDVLGQGTFGQVVKCQDMKTHEVVAVKVVKNKPAYFNQSMMEVTILELLNNQCDPHDEHHILRLRDSFIHRNHLCLVFELLSSNLYELIKQNQFQGLSTQLVKVFTAQLLDALTVLKEARLIHCDLKPENILLKSLQSPQIKVIDFGSACHERQTVYTYIQSRFYRSPEVLLGLPYTAAIDMWSLGCIAVELFLGLPLFPGTSEYNQITRIVEMLGQPPGYMMEMGKQTSQFFDSYADMYGRKKWRLKSLEQYSREHNTNEQPGKQYFKATTLPEIVNTAPMPQFKSGRQGAEMEKELNNRASFIDFCQGLLNMNPIERWSPQQARLHPFITGEKFTKPFVPAGHPSQQQQVSPSVVSPTSTTDPKRPFGGLVPSQPKAQAQAATQAANNVFRNPYITTQLQSQPSSSTYPVATGDSGNTYSQPPASQHPQYATSTQRSNNGSGAPQQTSYSSGRFRPRSRVFSICRKDVISGRNALTPVLNRDDAIKEWERRQSGKAAAAQPYPQLEYLQQQAELVGVSGIASWQQPTTRYQPTQSSGLSHQYHPPATIVVDDDRRDAIMSNVRATAQGQGYMSSNPIPNPPPAYTGAAPTAGSRFTVTYPQQPPAGSQSQSQQHTQPPQQQQQQSPTSPFDSLDRRPDMGGLFVPLQPDHYQAYTGASVAGARGAVAPPQPAGQPSFYDPTVAQQTNAAPQRNPFSGEASSGGGGAPGSGGGTNTTKDRRGSGIGLLAAVSPARICPTLNLPVWPSLHRSRLL
ncbi:kinase-like protein [Lactarius hengduanensis]|nr:kinase-like protein [Lactarius hengduanensis]